MQWPVYKVEAGLAYARAFPEEIEAAITEMESFDLEAIRRSLPQVQVFTVRGDTTDTDAAGKATRDVAPAAR